jgi:peptidoglycan/xylan/chitin deacetylase (PgdA/CDA1 family)
VTVLPYLWARSLECFFLAVRTGRRWRAAGGSGRGSAGPAGRRGGSWPVFTMDKEAIALTVDDGPHPAWTPALLDVLARHDVLATFFLIGDNVARYPSLAARIAAAGHAIGNHSLTHPQPFAALDRARLRTEIVEAQARITDAVGQPVRLFRAPGGGWSPAVLGVAADLGLTTVDWTVNPSDWKEPGTDHIVRVLARSRPGHVLLCHDGGGDRSQTVAALDHVIPHLRGRGVRFARVEPRSVTT